MRLVGMSATPALMLLLGLAACGGAPPAAPQAAAAPPAAAARPAAPAWQDLNGARGSTGEAELQRRGFEVAVRRGLTTFWGHIQSETCLRVVTSQGRYTITQVPFVPNCPV